MTDIPKHYDPAALEAKWYPWWVERGFFRADPDASGEPYVIVIPPPNVTGILHMGHALNNTIQDVLIRWRRMQGRNALWVPGTDHAGIATQNVVERALKKEGKRRQDLGREAFLERVWQWKADYGSTIIRQLKQLGAACDWTRERFTLDAGLSRAVNEVFVRLYEKGLIYRGTYIVNWCPRCQTALSDEENEHRDTHGKLYHLRYAVKGEPGRFVTVATTRPETYLGDTAVAVNPKDDRYRDLVGRTLTLPVIGREIPVIADDFVDPAFGTGCVKVTPAHDPNDFQMGQRHNLPSVNVMTDDGHMNAEAGPYAGLERFACRKKIMDDLDALGLLAKVEDHAHAVGHCYRCSTVIEPRLSPQWFVRMKPLAEPALAAVREGRVRFVPDRWNKVYVEWMENIRDWCISRQIWWGHRIPVFTCDACGREWADRGRPEACPVCGAAGIRQDPDVLDTWFSSWLWPFSVFGWPEATPDLKAFYPTHTLITASEILFFWVARMVMAGCEFMGRPPFSEVYIHGTVRDDQGRKMSKSLGNSIDPLTIIGTYSADALRASLMMLTATGQDVYISGEKFELGRNFGTKIWNAARFLQMQAPSAPPADVAAPALDPARLSSDDRHLLARLDAAIEAATGHLEAFRFNDYALALHDFVWGQFCDWYVEYAKEPLNGNDPARRAQTLALLHHVFSVSLRLLHPLMPFITEELWHGMGYGGAEESIQRAPWPRPRGAAALAALGVTPECVAYVEARHDLVRLGRQLRADAGLPPKQTADFVVQAASAAGAADLERDRAALVAALKAGAFEISVGGEPPAGLRGAVSSLGAIYLSVGQADPAAERAKLDKQLEKTAQDLDRVRAKLANPAFTGKAPREVVAVQERRLAELLEQQAALTALRAAVKE